MGTSNFSEEFKRDGVAQISGRGHPGCGSGEAARRQPTVLVRIEEEVLAAPSRGGRPPDGKDPAAQEGTGGCHGGA